MAKITTISLSKATYQRLSHYGCKNKSFDEIVSELLEFREDHND